MGSASMGEMLYTALWERVLDGAIVRVGDAYGNKMDFTPVHVVPER